MVNQNKARILIVDDEPGIRLSLQGILEEDEGHVVLEAETAEAALELVAKEMPDLVFLDIWLPGMDGIEILKALRGNPTTARIPVIIASARGPEYDKVVGLDLPPVLPSVG